MNQQQYTQLSEQLEQLCLTGAFEEMRQLASTHYKQAIEMHNDFIELQMLRYMMMASANLGQYDHLLHFFERYEYLCHALKDEQCLLFFNIYLMFIYNHQGYYQQSMYVLKRACRMALEKENQLAIIDAFSSACATATLIQQYDHAIQYALIGMTHLDENMRDSIFASRLEMNLSIALIHNGAFAHAKKYLARSRQTLDQPKYVRFVKDHAQYYRAKALLAEHEHDYLAAKVYLKQALTLLLKHHHIADVVHLMRANMHLGDTLQDDLYFTHASRILNTLVHSNVQQQIDDITLLNAQRHVERDQRATQTFDEATGVHRTKGAFKVVNDWLQQQAKVDCAVVMIGQLSDADPAFSTFVQRVNHLLDDSRVIVSFNAQQLLIFWRDVDDQTVQQHLANIETLAHRENEIIVKGHSQSTTTMRYAKELYNFAYAQLYYMRELDTQLMNHQSTK